MNKTALLYLIAGGLLAGLNVVLTLDPEIEMVNAILALGLVMGGIVIEILDKGKGK